MGLLKLHEWRCFRTAQRSYPECSCFMYIHEPMVARTNKPLFNGFGRKNTIQDPKQEGNALHIVAVWCQSNCLKFGKYLNLLSCKEIKEKNDRRYSLEPVSLVQQKGEKPD